MTAPSYQSQRGAEGVLEVGVAGTVTLDAPALDVAPLLAALAAGDVRRLCLVDAGIERWDSALLVFVRRLAAECAEHDVAVDRTRLPEGVGRLLTLGEAVPPSGGGPPRKPASLVARIGERTLASLAGAREVVTFVGDLVLATGRLLTGRPGFRRVDFFLLVQQCGAEALPIVMLISAIVGMILAFVGAVQLRQFGAGIYVADLVAIAMAREMGCLMTGIILSGRTGAAFAAQLGTMKVTEEVDALKTFGFAPMQFLVLPRVLALSLMMPLLCVFSDLVGIAGGGLVATLLLDLSPQSYVQNTLKALTLTHVALGVGKSVVFGVLIALFGCLRGIQCGSSASSVGDAATSAVVSSIVAIVVADGSFAIVTSLMGV
jgi:phospholipid/cholesterol/gamma-HCH transport system permease protein